MSNDDATPNSHSVRAAFADAGILDVEIETRQYPGETIFVVRVDAQQLEQSIQLAANISKRWNADTFAVVKAKEGKPDNSKFLAEIRQRGVQADGVARLVQVLTERSRTSEQNPSLIYIPDSTQQLAVVQGRKHHFVFGRRGVGKTALLLETKRKLELRGGKTIWFNVQPLRGLNAQQALLLVCTRMADLVEETFAHREKKPASVSMAEEVRIEIKRLSGRGNTSRTSIAHLVPKAQAMNAAFCNNIQNDVFLYLDDIQYMNWNELPWLLDHIHGVVRDTSVWIKAAGIRHQCKVFTDNPPIGLQIGHDASDSNLDITLEDADKARVFLGSILQSYMATAGIPSPGLLFSSAAVDRLVLASGGVPRDFLEMASRSLQTAMQRPKAKTVGVQDVNEAAGHTSKQKVGELEDDAASTGAQSAARLSSLNTIRRVLLEEEHSTFFRVTFADKESHPAEYRMLQSLMDLRMVHLLKSSLSEAHSAGQRAEVYMLDLSQYSGQRLKKNLQVLELNGKYLSLRKSGTTVEAEHGDSPKKLMKILRSAPYLELDSLEASL